MTTCSEKPLRCAFCQVAVFDLYPDLCRAFTMSVWLSCVNKSTYVQGLFFLHAKRTDM